MNSSNKKTQKEGLFANKKVLMLLEALKSPSAIGVYLTVAFVYFAYTFYQIRSQNEGERSSNKIFDIVEWIDLKTMDARFKVRGEQEPTAKVGLLTIDDRSVEEVGRWPWSREKIAHVVEQMMTYGASALGFDIVFSEPQLDGGFETLVKIEKQLGFLPPTIKSVFEAEKKKNQPDKILADALSKYTERNILGAFNEESTHGYRPYQDYCRNNAFKRANSEKFVKITNTTFIVDDVADVFVDLNFDPLFDQVFPYLESMTTEQALKEVFQKPNVDSLNQREKNQLAFMLEEANSNYCNRWLDKNDEFLEASKDLYLNIFQKSDLLKNKEFSAAIQEFKKNVKPHPVVQHNRWTINTDLIQEGASYTASFNAEQDSDGTIRRVSMFFRTGNKTGLSFIPSLALQTYLVANNYRADVEINNDPKNPNQKIITKFAIIDPSKDPEVLVANVPVDEQGRMKINYAGGTQMYPYLPAKELFTEKDQAVILQRKYNQELKKWIPIEISVKKSDFIKDRAFIFGATAIGVYDLRVTPFEKNYPGPETHVTALGNLFQQNFIKTHPEEEKIMVWALLVLGVILAFALSLSGAISGFFITVISATVIFYLDQVLFAKGLIATMALPAILVITQYIGMTFYKYLTEERKKKHLKSTFAKYVSPAVVDEILKDPENVELGGKKQRMTVFFSDVRGFTTFSEKLEPQVLSDVLTRYLTPMTQIVFANKGTLDKYMGDAMMAFFGAPIPSRDHAANACRTALQNLEKLKEIQDQFAKEGLPLIDVGIGINTGDMSVGNMGSDIVRSYTVMGDSVNLGSRLEGINKEYGTRIIISQFTQDDIKDQFTTREVDWVRVKGKKEPVRIFELISEGQPPADFKEMLPVYKKGFDLYHEKKFTEALDCFQQGLKFRPNDSVCELYVERCQDYINEPPPADWDGVYVMKTK